MALVHLAVSADSQFADWLQRVAPRDFMYDDCRFIFTEVVAMHQAGQPLGDKAALASWFKRGEVVNRMKIAKLEDWIEDGKPLPAAHILEIAIDGEFATVAHLDWYIREVRKWRVVRGLRYLAWELSRKVDELEPVAALAWLEEMTGELKKVASPLLEKP
ncbi:MAG: hypothetical protein L0Z50_12875 [Verrucomicrobiales bacterium]|nr:hypothetical protein [Verrucomicrobiales bacterium]